VTVAPEVVGETKKVVDTRSIQGGMWIPSLLEGMNESEMQLLGSKMSAADIYSVNNSSLKDAIVHFNGGCTAEVISSKGLLLTNHHCGYGQIQSHSTLENDYLNDGFWAMQHAEELPNNSLYVTFIKEIIDVTEQVFNGVDPDLNELFKNKIIDRNIDEIIASAQKEEWQEARIKSFYKGNQYLMIITETFNDIRLVGAPPSSIGKFGSDTDNWMWPRHTGDFSLFRIYADENNRPAAYSKKNVPYKPVHHLPISLDGVEENDFTLVFGFPGRTNEYLPAVGIEQITQVLNPAKIEIREAALELVDEFMRKDPVIKIKYASKYARIANYWKKWIGENQGIEKSNAIEQRKEMEKSFSMIVNDKDLVGYSSLLSDFEIVYKELEKYALARDYWNEVAYRNVELLQVTYRLYNLEYAYKSGGEAAFEKELRNVKNRLQGLYKNYSPMVDKPVFIKLMELYVKNVPEEFLPEALKAMDFSGIAEKIFTSSNLISWKGAQYALEGSPEEVLVKINKDEAYKLGKQLHETYYQQVAPTLGELELRLTALQKTYMKALIEVFPEKRFFPDANSTLRVTYGQVKGYQPKDGVYYGNTTYLEGVMEKYVPGDYEFDVPQKLIDLYLDRDYGVYASKGKMPVCFIGTNHTTGGNSGSPAIDANGNLIGLNFDRVWEGTMSDMNYDPAICRNIMVDIRYVLFIIDKYAGAKNLINELQLVHPKKTAAELSQKVIVP
jgi:hypothetical protein